MTSSWKTDKLPVLASIMEVAEETPMDFGAPILDFGAPILEEIAKQALRGAPIGGYQSFSSASDDDPVMPSARHMGDAARVAGRIGALPLKPFSALGEMAAEDPLRSEQEQWDQVEAPEAALRYQTMKRIKDWISNPANRSNDPKTLKYLLNTLEGVGSKSTAMDALGNVFTPGQRFTRGALSTTGPRRQLAREVMNEDAPVTGRYYVDRSGKFFHTDTQGRHKLLMTAPQFKAFSERKGLNVSAGTDLTNDVAKSPMLRDSVSEMLGNSGRTLGMTAEEGFEQDIQDMARGMDDPEFKKWIKGDKAGVISRATKMFGADNQRVNDIMAAAKNPEHPYHSSLYGDKDAQGRIVAAYGANSQQAKEFEAKRQANALKVAQGLALREHMRTKYDKNYGRRPDDPDLDVVDQGLKYKPIAEKRREDALTAKAKTYTSAAKSAYGAANKPRTPVIEPGFRPGETTPDMKANPQAYKSRTPSKSPSILGVMSDANARPSAYKSYAPGKDPASVDANRVREAGEKQMDTDIEHGKTAPSFYEAAGGIAKASPVLKKKPAITLDAPDFSNV